MYDERRYTAIHHICAKNRTSQAYLTFKDVSANQIINRDKETINHFYPSSLKTISVDNLALLSDLSTPRDVSVTKYEGYDLSQEAPDFPT